MALHIGGVGAIVPSIKGRVLGPSFGFLSTVFEALWYTVDGTDMLDLLGGDSLVLSSDPSTDYIPSNYAGTITAPDVAGLKTADVNNILFDGGGTPQALAVADYIDADLPRIPVKYDDASPHHIRVIGLFEPTYYATLTTSEKINISNYLDLWVFYWGTWLDAGSVEKDNRTF